MNMRKLIAVLAAMLMLCTIIPMGAISVSAAAEDNISTGFEDGTKGKWSISGSITADAAHTGNYGLDASATGSWGSLLKQTVTVTKNTAYSISFWYKSNSSLANGAFEMKYKDASGTQVKVPLLNLSTTAVTMNKSTTEWTQAVVYFATGDYTSIDVLFYRNASGAGDAASFYIDDIVMTNLGTIAHDGYYADGGFESGNANLHGSAAATGYSFVGEITTDAHSGNYAMKGVSTTKYDHYAQQYFRVAKNTDYTIKFWAKASGSGKIVRAYVNAKKFSSSSSSDLRGNYSQHTVNTGWEQFEVSFNSGENTDIVLSLCSSGSSSTFYIDDITVIDPNAVTPDEPDEPGDVSSLVSNGDFEAGNVSGWTTSNSVAVGAADLPVALTNGGSYAMKFTSTYYSYTNYVISVQKNTNYKVSLSVLSGKAGYPLNVRVRTNGSADLCIDQITPSTTSWDHITVYFNSGNETSLNLRLQSAWEAADFYFDNISVVAVENMPTSDGYLLNGGFETGDDAHWLTSATTSIVADPTGSNKGYVVKTNETGSGVNMFSQIAKNLKTNTYYKLSFKAYGYMASGKSAAFYVRFNSKITDWSVSTKMGIGTSSSGAAYTARINMNDSVGSWQDVSITFNSGNLTETIINIMNYRASYGQYYFDDFQIIEVKDPSFDGYLYNGDFETGDTTKWTKYNSTTASTVAAKNGTYGVIMKGTGGWGGLLNQYFTTEPGATYKISFWYKAVSRGVNFAVKDTNNNGTSLTSGYVSNTSWTLIEKEFVALSETTFLNFNGPGTEANGVEEVYADDITITLVKPAHTCEFVGTQTKAPTCEDEGVMTYACSCGEGTYTESIPALGHTAGAAADCENAQTCTVCGAVLNAAIGHNYVGAETKAPTCGEAGVMTYTCACGASYTESIPATGEHTYFDACSAVCEACGYEREVSHNIVHVDAVAPTCTAMGNVEYWYCDVCGAAWLDAECTMNTNLRAVKLPALEAVASIGDALYASLADALADAANGEIVLLADVELDAPIVIAKGEIVSLDLNGNTVVYNSTIQGENMITNKGTLTINDSIGTGVINYNYTGAADPSYGKGNNTISNSGYLTVNGGYITIANLRAHAKYPIDNNSTTGDAVLVINGGHLYNYNTSAIRMFCNSTTYKNSVTINGGLVEGYCAIWVQNPGKNTVNGQLTIAGGEIKSTASAYVNGTANLEDVSSAIYFTISGEGGAWDENSLISITGGVINENVYLADSAPSNLNVEGEAIFNGYVELPVPPCEHEYFYPCDAHCMLCGELTNPDASHTITHVEAVAPTCDAMGNLEFWYCADCGMAWLDEACTLNTNMMAVKLPAAHTYTDNCDSECDVCGEWRFDAPHNLTYVPGVVPANCLEEGYDEYWRCADCKGYFGDAEASWQINPGWMYYTGDCVRPEGSIPCAVVACTVCGNDVWGEACTRPENVPVCQDAECIYCGELCWGEGHSYGYDEETWESLIPLCQPGDCIHCGEHLDYIYECENGSWAPCSQDGECAYGCGKQYPATGIHAIDNACEGGMCWLCWEEIEGTGHVYFDDCSAICEACGYEREAGHNIVHVDAVAPTCIAMGNIEYWCCDVCGMAWLDEACTLNTNMKSVILPATGEHAYTDDFDADCNVCGEVRDIVAPVIDVKMSISEDVNGLAFRVEANVAGFAVKAGTFVQADYTNATYCGYKLIETGVTATNGVSTITIKGERMCELDENGKALFAYRIVNIPADKLDVEITMTPYYIVEIDGEIVTIEGDAVVSSYAEVAIG